MKKKLAFLDLVVIALLILFCIIFIYPLWTIFVATFSSPLDYVKTRWQCGLKILRYITLANF